MQTEEFTTARKDLESKPRGKEAQHMKEDAAADPGQAVSTAGDLGQDLGLEHVAERAHRQQRAVHLPTLLLRCSLPCRLRARPQGSEFFDKGICNSE